MPEITKLGRDGGRIRTQVVWLQICAQEVGVGSTCSAHSRLSRKLVDVKEEGGREESKGRKKESASGQIMREQVTQRTYKGLLGESGTKNMKGLEDELSIGLEEPGL